MPEHHDLIVVGAGPAGSSAAYHAAREGLDVLLLDRQGSPRDKPCGDGLMPHAASEISLMGLGDWLEEDHHGRFRGFSIYTESAFLKQSVPPTLNGAHGYTSRRIETDAKLLERAKEAGAQFMPQTRATEPIRSSAGELTGVTAEKDGETLRFRAPLLIVADGVGGFAAEGMKAHQNAVACRQYFRGVKGPDRDHLHVFVTRDMNEHGAGYGWVFHFGDGTANVGAGVSTRTIHETGRNLKDFYERFLEEPLLKEWLTDAEPEGPPKSWSLKMGMWGARRHSQGMMSVGDAGSMIHPISGEGVGYAIESGRLAAAWAYEAHSRKDFSAHLLRGYERQLLRRRGREHLSGYALVRLVPNLQLLEPLFKACERHPAARKTLVEGFIGDVPIYHILRHPGALATALRVVTERRKRDGGLV